MKEHLIPQADLTKLTGIPTSLIMDRYCDYYNWKVVSDDSHFKRKNLLNVKGKEIIPGIFVVIMQSNCKRKRNYLSWA